MLTELQRDAIAYAKRGDFSLVDAMELRHRIKDFSCCGGYLQGGRLRFLAITEDELSVICDECDDGQVDCPEDCENGVVACSECGHESKCEECDGKGTVTCGACVGTGFTDRDDLPVIRLETLNGDVFWHREEGPDDPCSEAGMEWVSFAWADKILTAYHQAKAEAAEAAAEAAKPPSSNADQNPFVDFFAENPL